MELLVLMKAVLVSTGVVSLAVILRLSLPVTLDILTNDLPPSWLRPPYLYILVNCIILSIVASSKMHTRGRSSASPEESGAAVVVAEEEREFDFVAEEEVVKEVVFGYLERKQEDDDAASFGKDVGETLPEMVKPPVEAEVLVEKPSYSSRFGHRKSVKASPEGKTVLKKVSRPKRQETLESTWRTLTEGRTMPLTRHLRKSDTIAGTPPQAAVSPPVHVMKKSDTFSYGTAGVDASCGAESPSSGSGGGKLRRESSLSQDELNRRVEAFIKKFNEEMRLQRQESLSQYQEMVSVGSTK